jgi:hypothetical protein
MLLAHLTSKPVGKLPGKDVVRFAKSGSFTGGEA